jgi:metal-responsive CopG/Arc/MetJ family transcriptional regulator
MYGARLPDTLVKEIDAWAKDNGTSRSEAIRRLVELGLKRGGPSKG